MKQYDVTIPFGGHLLVTVDAESEEEAINKAVESASLDNVSDWDVIRKVSKGNVLCFPAPWEVEVYCETEE